jgi:hypothetical protein
VPLDDRVLRRAIDFPTFGFESHPVPARINLLGVKGCGEQAALGTDAECGFEQDEEVVKP